MIALSGRTASIWIAGRTVPESSRAFRAARSPARHFAVSLQSACVPTGCADGSERRIGRNDPSGVCWVVRGSAPALNATGLAKCAGMSQANSYGIKGPSGYANNAAMTCFREHVGMREESVSPADCFSVAAQSTLPP